MADDFRRLEQLNTQMMDKWRSTPISDSNKRSFLGIQRLMKMARFFIQNERKDRDEETQRLRDRYNNSNYAQKRIRTIEDGFEEHKAEVLEGIQKDIKDMISNKVEMLDKMIVETPSDAQIRLLQTLQMRGRNIGRAELMKLLPHFFGNYEATKCLETIAQAAGLTLHTPYGTDIMQMYNTLAEGAEYLTRASVEITKDGKPDMAFRQFYYIDDKEETPMDSINIDPRFQRFIDTFDSVRQLQDYTFDELTESETARIHAYFSQIDSFDENNAGDQIKILALTRDILEKHPEDIPLMKKSVYARFVNEVEELNAINEKQIETNVLEHKEAVSNG